jgi:hypothetical protein
MDAWHVTIAAEGRVRLFPEPAQRLRAIRAALRTLGPRLWSFGFVDDHDHFVVRARKDEIALVAGNLRRVLRKCDGAPDLQPAHRKPVDGRPHLLRLLAYHVEQPAKHGLLLGDAHPAAWNGSSFSDLAGARRLPGFAAAELGRELPRVDVAALVLRAAGLGEVSPAGDDDLAAAGTMALWEAVLSAAGLPGALRDTPEEVAARAAFVRLVGEAGLDRAEGAGVLGHTARSWRRLELREADPALLAAVRKRVAIDRAASRTRLVSATTVATA